MVIPISRAAFKIVVPGAASELWPFIIKRVMIKPPFWPLPRLGEPVTFE
jgi:hypothetical protein